MKTIYLNLLIPENIKLIKKERELHKTYYVEERKCRDSAEKYRQDQVSDKEMKTLCDNCSKAYEELEKFRKEHAEVLLYWRNALK